MRGRIVELAGAIARACDDSTFDEDRRADRYLAARPGGAGLGKGYIEPAAAFPVFHVAIPSSKTLQNILFRPLASPEAS